MNMVKQLDDETFSNTPQKTAKSPLKKLFVTRAEETDEMLREVERKMERLRVLSSSHDNDAGNRREIGGILRTAARRTKENLRSPRAKISPRSKNERTKKFWPASSGFSSSRCLSPRSFGCGRTKPSHGLRNPYGRTENI